MLRTSSDTGYRRIVSWNVANSPSQEEKLDSRDTESFESASVVTNTADSAHRTANLHSSRVWLPQRFSNGGFRKYRPVVILVACLMMIIIMVFTIELNSPTPSKDSSESIEISSSPPIPPQAKRIPSSFKLHNVTITDDYAWLKNESMDPNVMLYIQAENNYTAEALQFTKPTQKILIKEIKKWRNALSPEEGPCATLGPEVTEIWEEGHFFYWISYLNDTDRPVYFRVPLSSNNVNDDEPKKEMYTCGCPMIPKDLAPILDLNKIVPSSLSSTYFSMGVFEVSMTHPHLIAYSIDLTGNEQFSLFIKNISSDELIGPKYGIPFTYDSVRWAQQENQLWLYYNVVDLNWGTPRQIYRYCVIGCPGFSMNKLVPYNDEYDTIDGMDEYDVQYIEEWYQSNKRERDAQGKDEINAEKLDRRWQKYTGGKSLTELVYEEQDKSMAVKISLTNDGRYLIVIAFGQVTSEIIVYDNHNPSLPGKSLFGRQVGTQYDIQHMDSYFIIRTNAGASNFKLIRILSSTLFSSNVTHTIDYYRSSGIAEIILSESDTVFIERFETFQSHIIAWVWENGLQQILLIQPNPPFQSQLLNLSPSSQVYSIFPGTTRDSEQRLYRRYESKCLMISNSSYLQPWHLIGVDMDSSKITLLKGSQSIGFDKSKYIEKRILVPSSLGNDSIKIPLAIISDINNENKPRTPRDTFLTAYGAYGSFIQPEFFPDIFPLLTRNVNYAVCHPRGDGDLGSFWYEQGKFEMKENTFLDVRDCMQYLVDAGWTERGRIAFLGRSAGGLIAGSVFNRWGWVKDSITQDSFARVVVAQVPFVDVIGDMVDEDMPWTAYEWYEWGNPMKSISIFNAMMKYSPYGNIPNSQPLPSLMVTGGLADSRVKFYEPLKYMAKIRHLSLKYPKDSFQKTIDGWRWTKDGIGLLRISSNGHFSNLEETAEVYAFILAGLDLI